MVTIFTSTVPFYTLFEHVNETYVILCTTYIHSNGGRFRTQGIFNTSTGRFTVLSCRYFVDRSVQLPQIRNTYISYYPDCFIS